MINKQQLIYHILESLEIEAENLASAAKTARIDATNPESKAENKYDTRGLEAAYLAGAQAKMASELFQNISSYKNIKLKEFSSQSKIALTALIELESSDAKRSFYFLGPNGGGTEVILNGTKVLLITPSSPLGKNLLGREVGDCIKMQSGNIKKEYEIISIH